MTHIVRFVTDYAAMPILAPPERPVRTTTGGRLVAAGVAAGCLGVLVAAAYLAPDPAGVGTTARLGLEPCGFLRNTGLPCAGCGLTTSFSHAVRWQWLSAAWVQPLGAALVAATAITFWVAGYVAVTGRPTHRLISRGFVGRGVQVVLLVAGLAVAAWSWKIAVVLLEVDGAGVR